MFNGKVHLKGSIVMVVITVFQSLHKIELVDLPQPLHTIKL